MKNDKCGFYFFQKKSRKGFNVGRNRIYPPPASRSPVRDDMWVENGCTQERERAVRYAIFFDIPSLRDFPNVWDYIFYPHFVPKGTLTSSLL